MTCTTSVLTSASIAPPASRSGPVTAIFEEDSTPPQFAPYIPMNYDYFTNTDPSELKTR